MTKKQETGRTSEKGAPCFDKNNEIRGRTVTAI